MLQAIAVALLLASNPAEQMTGPFERVRTPRAPAVEYTPSGAGMSLSFPAPRARETAHGHIVEFPGLPLRSATGEPLLPYRRVVFPLPPHGEPEVRLEGARTAAMAPPGRLAITPALRGTGLETVEDYSIPLREGPDSRMEYRVMHLAGSRVAVVDVYPYLPSSPGSYLTSARLSVTWPETPGWRRLEEGPLAAVCPPGALWWPGRGAKAESPFWGRPWARMEIDQTGVYCLTGAELEAAGCQVTGSPSSTLRMLTGAGVEFDIFDRTEEQPPQEVAVRVLDGGDGTFDTADSLLFFARSLNRFLLSDGGTPQDEIAHVGHEYDDRNVYWLTWGGQEGRTMEEVGASPDGSPDYGDSSVHHLWMEEDYAFSNYNGWTWYRLYPRLALYIYLQTPDASGPGTIDLSFAVPRGNAPVDVILDGDTLFSGTIPPFGNLQLDSVDLGPAPRLTVRPDTGSWEENYLEHVYVRYPRQLASCGGRLLFPRLGDSARRTLELGMADQPLLPLDVSDPLDPLVLDGGAWSDGRLTLSHDLGPGSALYLCRPDDLLKPDSLFSAQPGRIVGSLEPVDVVLIAGGGLLQASEPLRALYQQRGRSCHLVSLQEVADEFGAGVMHPGAVRSFIRHMLDVWSDPVEEVVFVGDGHYDVLNRITSSPCPFPVWYFHQYWNTLVCKDDFFALCHEGQEVPEVPVSRIPADDPAQLAGIISKLAAREESLQPGEWACRDLLIADDEWGQFGANESTHTEQCDIMADSMPPRYRREKFYLIEYPWPPGTDPDQGAHPDKPEAREDLVAEMSQGWRTAWYFGHGSYGQLAQEKLLLSADGVRVTAGPASPVLLTFCCNSGDYFLTADDCLAEYFVLAPEGGSIASVSPIGGTLGPPNLSLAMAIAESIEEGAPAGIGSALWEAKVELSNSGSGGRASDPTGNSAASQYHCLGDGGVVVPAASHMPGGMALEGDTLFRGRTARLDLGGGGASSLFARLTESGSYTQYTMLGGTTMTYLRNGGAFYNGSLAGGQGPISLDVFVPVQADTGQLARCGALAVGGPEGLSAEALEWVSLLDRGGYEPDSTPPEVDLWLEGARGEEEPAVWGGQVVRAHLEDESGICVLGGAAGRSLLLSVDGQGFDVGDHFSYRQGSSTSGDLEYSLPALSLGEHRLILAAWDGMANGVQDTLDFQVVEPPERLISQVLVYPNPGDGVRVFSFQATSPGSVEATVYTASGRAVWHGTSDCSMGYNQLVWDGRDDDGDRLACGTYIYRLRMESDQGGAGEKVGRLVVIR